MFIYHYNAFCQLSPTQNFNVDGLLHSDKMILTDEDYIGLKVKLCQTHDKGLGVMTPNSFVITHLAFLGERRDISPIHIVQVNS